MSQTYLPQVPDAGQRIIWMLWRCLEQCVRRSFNFKSRNWIHMTRGRIMCDLTRVTGWQEYLTAIIQSKRKHLILELTYKYITGW